ncbi:MAG: 2Fe-2S iron-sulfur cluster-binding protein [Polyangiaceae bacterium]
MVELVFEGTSDGVTTRCHARPGDAIVDLCDEHDAPVPFGCRSASCATCAVIVDDPHHVLAAPEPEEQDLLASEQLSHPHRLACQARIRDDAPNSTGDGSPRVQIRIP